MMHQHFRGSSAFKSTWSQFKVGIGNASSSYWIGNDRLHNLTMDGSYKLRIDLLAVDNRWYWASYTTFSVGDEASGYRLSIGGYSGTAGDGMGPVSGVPNGNFNGMKFTTWDRDNDVSGVNCANWSCFAGGFWFNDCVLAGITSTNTGVTVGFSWIIGPLVPNAGFSYNLVYARMTLVKNA